MNQHSNDLEWLQALHVLVVDDDDFMRDMIGDILRQLGVRSIATAADGEQGFAAFETARLTPDIIICDINMPRSDGFQMMELLARERPGCGIIFISALEQRFVHSATLMGQFHHLNVLGALHKPVEKAALSALMAKWRRPAS